MESRLKNAENGEKKLSSLYFMSGLSDTSSSCKSTFERTKIREKKICTTLKQI